MARPLSATDDQILEAAQEVLLRRGLDGFSVSEVAREVGLSRTAITLRFKSGDELKRTLVRRRVAQYEAQVMALDVEQGSAGLLAIVDMIAEKAGSRDKFSSFMLRYTSNIKDPILLELEQRRGQILRTAIAKVMPETAIDKSAAVDAFMANITGSLLNWQPSHDMDARQFLRERTFNWLRLVGIPVDEAQG
ncbi:TetR/AcrR family transcriptional regulator [Phenylobacterium sp. LjRoot225]|uniref:TetR/AcrR family transcriptional regulator n=1 Tax=Phenylobacterium sp. LjRoot225 TaxID=3342285 RepID=UPI003ECD781A